MKSQNRKILIREVRKLENSNPKTGKVKTDFIWPYCYYNQDGYSWLWYSSSHLQISKRTIENLTSSQANPFFAHSHQGILRQKINFLYLLLKRQPRKPNSTPAVKLKCRCVPAAFDEARSSEPNEGNMKSRWITHTSSEGRLCRSHWGTSPCSCCQADSHSLPERIQVQGLLLVTPTVTSVASGEPSVNHPQSKFIFNADTSVPMHMQSPPKVLKQQGQFLCFCNTLNTSGVEIKRFSAFMFWYLQLDVLKYCT